MVNKVLFRIALLFFFHIALTTTSAQDKLGIWQLITVNQSPPVRAQIMGYEKSSFSNALAIQMWQGGINMTGSEPQNAIVGYSAGLNQYVVLDIGPGFTSKSEYMNSAGHDRFSAIDQNRHMWVQPLATTMNSRQRGWLQYDLVGNTGRLYFAPPGLTSFGWSSGVYDPDSSCLYLLESWVAPPLKHFAYNVKRNEWKRLASLNSRSIM